MDARFQDGGLMDATDFQRRQEERRAAKAKRLREKAGDAWEAAHSTSRHGPPMGEPIKVGHHSERRHRKHFETLDRQMGRAVAAEEEARHAEALAARSVTAISSDDPDAVPALHAKLEELEAQQERMKRLNKAHKAYLKHPDGEWGAGLSEDERRLVETYEPAQSWEPHPFPPYVLQNNNANMRRVRQRIKELEAKSRAVDREVEVDGVRVLANTEANRLQLFFPDKPDAATRAKLKANGFRWAPSAGAWQRQLTANAVHATTTFLSWSHEEAHRALVAGREVDS